VALSLTPMNPTTSQPKSVTLSSRKCPLDHDVIFRTHEERHLSLLDFIFQEREEVDDV
jgi:hypothetical protein